MTVSQIDQQQDGLPLPGLDGTNPLGFLAALGLFRVVTVACSESFVRLRWRAASQTWVPQLIGPVQDANALLDLLDQQLVRIFDRHPLSELSTLTDDQNVEHRRAMCRSLVFDATLKNYTLVEWLAALTSDAVPPSENSQLQTVRRDYFKGNIESVIERTERHHIARSVFRVWDYADSLDNQSLHFDPSEDRRHAHQWNTPSGDPDRKRYGGMLGANRLAIEALPIFTSLPKQDRLHTLGFTGFRSNDTRWTWPLWKRPIGLEATRSLLTLADIQKGKLSGKDIRRLNAQGVVATLRTRRILVGKTPNFTPAQRIA